jgi:integrase
MLKVNFNLRKQNSQKPEIIYLVARWQGNYLRYSTRLAVLPKNWDIKKQRVKAVINEPFKNQINQYLGEIAAAAHSVYIESLTGKKPLTKTGFKQGLNKWANRDEGDQVNFWGFIETYILHSVSRIDPKTGKTISPRTVQEYKTTAAALKEFEAENRQKIDFETINIFTLSDFRDFLTTVKGYAVNNVAKHIDNLRQFLRAAAAKKIEIDPDTINPQRFKNAREQAQSIYLTEGEILAINTAPGLTEQQTRAKDLFIIGCYTGLRVSDYKEIKPHNIKAGTIEIYQAKTGGKVVIPIHPTVKTIIEKYAGTLPTMPEQKINKHIKEVAKAAGICEKTEMQQTKAGQKRVTIKEKWELVTSHTARRSFASNMVKQGLPIQSIMKITGHTKESTFLKYVKLTAAEHAEMIIKHWHQKPHLKAV